MSSRRLATALSLTAREFLRRKGMLAFMVGIPIFGFLVIYWGLPRTPAALEAFENGVEVLIDMDQVQLFGGVMSLIYVGLLAAITGFYLLQGALKADRRLLVAGYSAAELVIARVGLLLLFNVVLTIFLVSLTLFFMVPRQFLPYVLAVYWCAMIYSFYGGLAATLVRSELGGIIAIMFLINIDVGYLEIPGYSTVLDEWWARLLPAYFPVQLAIDAAFTARAELLLPSFWSVPHGLVVAGLMLAAYDRATHIHPFLPERPRRRMLWGAVAAGALLLATAGGALAYRYYSGQPATVEADGRVSAPQARVVSPLSGRIRELAIVEGQEVEADQTVAWVEDTASNLAMAIRAPVSGQVTSLPVRRGENVVAGSVLATIHQLDRLEVVLEVEETAIGQVLLGQAVELRFASLGETAMSAVVEIATEPLPPEPGTTEKSRRVRKYAVKAPLPFSDSRLRLDLAVHGRIFK